MHVWVGQNLKKGIGNIGGLHKIGELGTFCQIRLGLTMHLKYKNYTVITLENNKRRGEAQSEQLSGEYKTETKTSTSDHTS